MTVIETVADDTLVFLQVHKRIWPASQRDSLFWSHMRQVPDHNDPDGHDIWIVCNHSTDNRDFPVSSPCFQHKTYAFIKSLNALLIYESPEIKLIAGWPWNSCSARNVCVVGVPKLCTEVLSSSYK
jgi:START domain.